MRPSARAAKKGSRPPAIRLRTRAVMKTVLPERASPVTPSRRVGVARLEMKALAVSTASRAASATAEKRTGGSLSPRGADLEAPAGEALRPARLAEGRAQGKSTSAPPRRTGMRGGRPRGRATPQAPLARLGRAASGAPQRG